MNRHSAFAAALALATLLGCTTAAKTVATAQNGYDWFESVYEERCVVPAPPTECAATMTDLHTFEKHLHLSAKALKAGGGMSLQLKALHADEKKLTARTVLK